MTIETSLNINDEIFFLHERKVINSKVQCLKIEVDNTGKPDIIYICNEESDKRVNLRVSQDYAFKSKSELLKSL